MQFVGGFVQHTAEETERVDEKSAAVADRSHLEDVKIPIYILIFGKVLSTSFCQSTAAPISKIERNYRR